MIPTITLRGNVPTGAKKMHKTYDAMLSLYLEIEVSNGRALEGKQTDDNRRLVTCKQSETDANTC